MPGSAGFPWSTLDLDPTHDESAIRRAYARRLKATRADEDPEAFQQLRRARSQAFAAAEAMRRDLSENEWQDNGDGDRREGIEAGQQETGVTGWRDLEAPAAAPPLAAEAVGEIDGCSPSKEPAPVWSDLEARSPSPYCQDLPHGSVVELAPLEEVEESLRGAACLKDALALLAPLRERKRRRAKVDIPALEVVLRGAGALARGQRGEIEAALLLALLTNIRSNSVLNREQALRIAPVLAAADAAFGWTQDDAVISATLRPADADVLHTILAAQTIRGLPLRTSDAKAFFGDWPKLVALREQLTTGRPLPWRFDMRVCLLPHVWAYDHRLWPALVVIYSIMGAGSMLSTVGSGIPALAAAGVVIVLATMVVVGFCTQRILASAAVAKVRQADRLGFFDPVERERFLRRSHDSRFDEIVLAFLGWPLVMLPYTGVLMAILAFLGSL